ncbi:MAG: helix-turn-helix domain-containing protein [Hyphomicrobiaceae bacterium]
MDVKSHWESRMYSNPQKRSSAETHELRRAAGVWLRQQREAAGLSQRDLAALVGLEYYTFISQLENGRGRLPPDQYELWAAAFGMPVYDLVFSLLRYYDPVTFDILFGRNTDTRRTSAIGRTADLGNGRVIALDPSKSQSATARKTTTGDN